jgi:hypothetical protein
MMMTGWSLLEPPRNERISGSARRKTGKDLVHYRAILDLQTIVRNAAVNETT